MGGQHWDRGVTSKTDEKDLTQGGGTGEKGVSSPLTPQGPPCLRSLLTSSYSNPMITSLT